MIPGGNLVAGFAHARDLVYVSKWIKQYHSDEKVIETLWKYQDVGINTVTMRTDEQTIRILKKFWKGEEISGGWRKLIRMSTIFPIFNWQWTTEPRALL